MIVVIITLTFCFTALSNEIPYFVRSPKALLMGDAYTAAPSDEYSIYYNPASLGNGKLIEFSALNPSFSTTNILEELDKFDNLSSDVEVIASTIMGTPLLIQGMGGPVLKFGPVGLGLLANMKTNFILRNAIYPQLEVDYVFDKGFIFAYAHSWGRGGKYEKYNPYKRKKLSSSGYRLSIGASAKFIDRSVLSGNYSLFGVKLLNSITGGANNLTQMRENLGYARGSAWGFDTGATFLYSTGRSEFSVGLSIADVAGTDFDRKSGTENIAPQPMIMSSGISFSQSLSAFGYRLSVDLHPVNSSYEFLRKLHLGGEISLPMLDILVGYGAGYLSYGVQFDLWLLKVTAGFYGVELGSSYREQEAARAVVQVSLLDFAYDI